MTRIIRKTLAAWQRWRFLRHHPAIADLTRKEAEARRKHRPTRPYQAAKQARVLEALRAGR